MLIEALVLHFQNLFPKVLIKESINPDWIYVENKKGYDFWLVFDHSRTDNDTLFSFDLGSPDLLKDIEKLMREKC